MLKFGQNVLAVQLGNREEICKNSIESKCELNILLLRKQSFVECGVSIGAFAQLQALHIASFRIQQLEGDVRPFAAS